LTSYIVIRRQKTAFDRVGYVYDRCLHSLFTNTATNDLCQADRPTNGSSNVNFELTLRVGLLRLLIF